MAGIFWILREYLIAPGVGFLALIVVLFVSTYALLGVRNWWLTARLHAAVEVRDRRAQLPLIAGLILPDTSRFPGCEGFGTAGRP